MEFQMLMLMGVGFAPLLQWVLALMFRRRPKANSSTKSFLLADEQKQEVARPPFWLLPGRILCTFMFLIPGLVSLTYFFITVLLPVQLLYAWLPAWVAQSVLVGLCGLAAWELANQFNMPSEELGDSTPPAVKKRVGIIGAGPAGLVVAKELLAEGHEPVIFDRTSDIGGLWQRNAERSTMVLEDTFTSSSAINTAFSDFPIQPEFGGSETYCMHQEGYMEYLRSYAEHFKLSQYVKFHQEVVALKQKPGCTKWLLLARDSRDPTAKIIEHEFEFVSVCSGQAAIPRIPTLQGQEHFKGTIRHSSVIHNPEDLKVFANRKVLCVGGGESASDISRAVASQSSLCDLSIRNPVVVLARNYFGAHPDYQENRTMFTCPTPCRWAAYKISLLLCLPLNWCWARIWDGKIFWQPSYFLHLKVLFTPKFIKEFLSGARSLCSSLQVTKTENFLYVFTDSNKAAFQRGVDRIDGTGRVVFEDGSVKEYDDILLLTGYLGNKFPFLPPGFNDPLTHTRNDRYLGVFHPSLPGLAFIGFVRGQVGSLSLGFEMQARWLALLLSGKRALPSVACMKKVIARDCLDKDCYEYTRATWIYANYLARHHVKCEPNTLQFLLEAPLTCLKAYCSAPAGYLYRMRGPHANKKAAIEGYALSSAAIYDCVPTWLLNHPLWYVTGLACHYFWSRLPVIGMWFTPIFGQYY